MVHPPDPTQVSGPIESWVTLVEFNCFSDGEDREKCELALKAGDPGWRRLVKLTEARSLLVLAIDSASPWRRSGTPSGEGLTVDERN